jgi:opacity protein-like surface antigen
LRLPARTILAVAFLAPALAPSRALAQEERIDTPYRWIDRSLRVGLYGSYIATDPGGLDQGPRSSPLFGSRFRVRLSSPLSFEVNVGYASTERDVVYPLAEGGPAVVDRVGLDYLLLEGYLQLALTGARSLHRLQPYLLLGGGVLLGINEEISEEYETGTDGQFRFELGTRPSIAIGGGVEWDISDRIGLALEIRDHLWRIQTPDAWFRLDVLEAIDAAGATAPSEAYWTNNLEFGATLYYYF